MSKTRTQNVENFEAPSKAAEGAPRGWAQPWLESVAMARKAVERERAAAEAGVADRTRTVDAYVEAEEALRGGAGSRIRWAFDRLAEFDAAMDALRERVAADGVSGAWSHDVFDGSYALEYRYRLGYDDAKACDLLMCGRSTLWRKMGCALDYMEMAGPARLGARPDRF